MATTVRAEISSAYKTWRKGSPATFEAFDSIHTACKDQDASRVWINGSGCRAAQCRKGIQHSISERDGHEKVTECLAFAKKNYGGLQYHGQPFRRVLPGPPGARAFRKPDVPLAKALFLVSAVSAPLGISIRQFAEREGCSDKLVRNKIAQGALATLADGTLDPQFVGTGWRKKNRTQQSADTPSKVSASHPADKMSAPDGLANMLADLMRRGELLSYQEAEKLKMNYEGLLKQLQYDQKSGEVVLVSLVAQTVASEYAKVRTRLLAIPAEQAPGLHRLKTVTEVQDALSKTIHEALEELTFNGAAPAS